MAIRDRLLHLEQRLKRLAGETAPSEPIEIRQAIIQQAVDLAQPAGRGRRVMPFDRVDVEVVAPTADARRVFEAVLARDEGVDASIRRALSTVGCDPPAHFQVEVHYRKRPAATWAHEQRFAVTARVVEAVAPASSAPAPASAPSQLALVTLKVIGGRAARRSLEVRAAQINIGRLEDVSDRDRRLVRRNHLVFAEGDPLSDTVSRAHAHIRCAASGECRLRDDNSAYGTRIVRDGQTIEVLPTNPRGVRLHSGDELHLGRAIVRVTLE